MVHVLRYPRHEPSQWLVIAQLLGILCAHNVEEIRAEFVQPQERDEVEVGDCERVPAIWDKDTVNIHLGSAGRHQVLRGESNHPIKHLTICFG